MSGQNKNTGTAMIPVMFGFIVMGVIDVAGLARNYFQQDLELSERTAGMLPSVCFLWFLLLAIPAGTAADRIGKKQVTVISMLTCGTALLMPFLFKGSLAAAIASLSLLGIGCTLLNVAFNPLIKDVCGGRHTAGALSIGSGLKSLTAVAMPLLMGLLSNTKAGWQGCLLVFSAICFAGAIWLLLSTIEERNASLHSSLKTTFKLLTKRRMLLYFLEAMLLVGIDVSLISYLPKLLCVKLGSTLDEAVSWSSIYPLSKMAAAFIGGALLLRISEKEYAPAGILLMLAGAIVCLLSSRQIPLFCGVAIFAAGYSNLFSIIYSAAMNSFPGRENEVSSLMITSLAGGALITPLIGLIL